MLHSIRSGATSRKQKQKKTNMHTEMHGMRTYRQQRIGRNKWFFIFFAWYLRRSRAFGTNNFFTSHGIQGVSASIIINNPN